MLKIKSLLSLFFIILSCKSSSKLEIIFEFPSIIKESSALEITNQSNIIWTLQDQNNQPILYGLNFKGKITQQITITDVKNNDWEDLTSDPEGNLYIGDFGNNNNERKNLAIYKINKNDLNKKQTQISSKIEFYYPNQNQFPPKKSKRFFDCEAFFLWENHFYLFSKNRSSNYDGTVYVYKIPNITGRHPAEKIGEWKSCNQYKSCAITSADINSTGTEFTLLASDRIWIFSNFNLNNPFKGNVKEIALNHYSQKEGICYKSNKTLYISDEKSKKKNSYLYQYQLD